jgi:hypothetical protein
MIAFLNEKKHKIHQFDKKIQTTKEKKEREIWKIK